MTRHRLRLLAIVFLVCVGGCVELDTPLSDPAKAEVDKTLCGVWRPTKDDGDNQNYLFVGSGEGNDGVPAGLMRWTMPSFNRTSLKVDPSGPMCGFVTRIKDATYFNAIGTEDGRDLMEKGNFDAWAARPVRKTSLCKYKVDSDNLTVWLGLGEKSYKAFAAKHNITDSASLAGYLEQSGDRELFPDERPTTQPGEELDFRTVYKVTYTRVR